MLLYLKIMLEAGTLLPRMLNYHLLILCISKAWVSWKALGSGKAENNTSELREQLPENVDNRKFNGPVALHNIREFSMGWWGNHIWILINYDH